MTVEWSDGSATKYIGALAIWHKLPKMKRCSARMDSTLYGLYTYNRNFGKYPDAHKNYKAAKTADDLVDFHPMDED